VYSFTRWKNFYSLYKRNGRNYRWKSSKDILSGSRVSINAVGGNGTQLDDFIYADSGNDTIYGQHGHDHLSRRDGDDIIYGDNG
jgi:Ca2+-binding RTX toxin-like protein